MADMPIEKSNPPAESRAVQSKDVQVTHENAELLTVHFLSQIYSRLGYIVKLLEEKGNG
jgi:hypothetical protein